MHKRDVNTKNALELTIKLKGLIGEKLGDFNVDSLILSVTNKILGGRLFLSFGCQDVLSQVANTSLGSGKFGRLLEYCGFGPQLG